MPMYDAVMQEYYHLTILSWYTKGKKCPNAYYNAIQEQEALSACLISVLSCESKWSSVHFVELFICIML